MNEREGKIGFVIFCVYLYGDKNMFYKFWFNIRKVWQRDGRHCVLGSLFPTLRQNVARNRPLAK